MSGLGNRVLAGRRVPVGDGVTLLFLDGDPGAAGDLRELLGGLALVRPEGYVGLLSADVDPDTVRRYLADALHVRDEALAQRVAR